VHPKEDQAIGKLAAHRIIDILGQLTIDAHGVKRRQIPALINFPHFPLGGFARRVCRLLQQLGAKTRGYTQPQQQQIFVLIPHAEANQQSERRIGSGDLCPVQEVTRQAVARRLGVVQGIFLEELDPGPLRRQFCGRWGISFPDGLDERRGGCELVFALGFANLLMQELFDRLWRVGDEGIRFAGKVDGVVPTGAIHGRGMIGRHLLAKDEAS
jgi:hypothetical protein